MANSIPLIIALLFLFPHSFPSDHTQYPSHACRDLVVEDKVRLGSTPPSCHNKCNLCHPCTAVKVPTLPSHRRVDPASSNADPCSDATSSAGNLYSNYKPLKWKCRCADQFYNP